MMTKKTEFEELYSKINYTDYYDKDRIQYLYVDEDGFRSFYPEDILKFEDKMFHINKEKNDDWELVQIPVYRIYVVLYGDDVIFNRIRGYNGRLDLNESLENFLDAIKG